MNISKDIKNKYIEIGYIKYNSLDFESIFLTVLMVLLILILLLCLAGIVFFIYEVS